MPAPLRTVVALVRTPVIVAVLFCDAALGDLVLRLDDGGRVAVRGIVDADDAALRVAATGERIRIDRSIPWRRVIAAELDGTRYSRAELRLAVGLEPHGGPPASASAVGAAPPSVPILPPPPCVLCGPSAVPPGRVVGVRPDPLQAPVPTLGGAYSDVPPALP